MLSKALEKLDADATIMTPRELTRVIATVVETNTQAHALRNQLQRAGLVRTVVEITAEGREAIAAAKKARGGA